MKTFYLLISSIISIGFVFGSFANNGTQAWANGLDPLDIWHVRNAPVSNQLFAVTYEKNIFVAVGHNGTILTSPNGTIWTNRSVSGISNLISVAYGNNVFIAVGWDGTILTSPGGVTWTRRISGTSVWLKDIIFAGNTFVVVGNSGTILTSQDGITWTAKFSGTTKTLFSVTYGKGVFVVTGGGSDSLGGTYTKLVLTSSDAITWTQRLSGNGKIPTFVAYGNSTFVGIDSDGTVFTSSDGITWIIMDSSIPFDIGIIKEMVYVPSAFIAIGCPSDIFTSPDGITWTSSDSGVPGTLSGVTYGNNSVVIVGLGYIYDDPGNPFGGGTGTNIILQSDPFASPTTPIPVSSQSFTYSATTAPVLSADPSQAKPMGLGPVAEGGGTLSITVKTYQFSGPVDIYFGLYSPEIDPDNIYL
ncbi:MAG: hypothetical protein KAV87_58600, partial [Desulfobacteraceae bacterium]|nr:hypothetical protein [Desulfobacteraceae bacterium]